MTAVVGGVIGGSSDLVCAPPRVSRPPLHHPAHTPHPGHPPPASMQRRAAHVQQQGTGGGARALSCAWPRHLQASAWPGGSDASWGVSARSCGALHAPRLPGWTVWAAAHRWWRLCKRSRSAPAGDGGCGGGEGHGLGAGRVRGGGDGQRSACAQAERRTLTLVADTSPSESVTYRVQALLVALSVCICMFKGVWG